MSFIDILKVRTWSLDRSQTANVTEYLKTVNWSGSYTDCCRKLSFDLLADGLSELGGLTRLYKGTDILFSGTVMERSRDSMDQYFTCAAYDRGIYLKNNLRSNI